MKKFEIRWSVTLDLNKHDPFSFLNGGTNEYSAIVEAPDADRALDRFMNRLDDSGNTVRASWGMDTQYVHKLLGVKEVA